VGELGEVLSCGGGGSSETVGKMGGEETVFRQRRKKWLILGGSQLGQRMGITSEISVGFSLEDRGMGSTGHDHR